MQETRFTRDAVRSHISKLSPIMRGAILSSHMEKVLRNITAKHHLHIDKAGILAEEVNYALIGLSPAGDLVKHLKNRLGISEEAVTALAKDVNDKIFTAVRDAVREETERKKKEEEALANEKAEQKEKEEETARMDETRKAPVHTQTNVSGLSPTEGPETQPGLLSSVSQAGARETVQTDSSRDQSVRATPAKMSDTEPSTESPTLPTTGLSEGPTPEEEAKLREEKGRPTDGDNSKKELDKKARPVDPYREPIE